MAAAPHLPSPTRYQIRVLPAADPRGTLVVELSHHPERVGGTGNTLEALFDRAKDILFPFRGVEYLEIRVSSSEVRVVDAHGDKRRSAVAVAHVAQVLVDASAVVLVLNDGARDELVVVDPAAASATANAIARYLDRLNAPPPPPLPHVDCTRCSTRLDLVDADRERLTLDCTACGAVVDVSRYAALLRTLPPRARWRRRRGESTPQLPEGWSVVVDDAPPAIDAPHRAVARRGTLRIRTPRVGAWARVGEMVGATPPEEFELTVDDDTITVRDRRGERRVPLAELAQLDAHDGELHAITHQGIRVPMVRTQHAAAIEARVERHLTIDDAELLA